MRWPLLDAVPPADLERLLKTARQRSFGKGEVVFHEGDPADTVHLIESGRFAVRVRTQYADEAILAVLGAGETCGELALLSPGAPRSASMVALEESRTLSIHQLDFQRLRRQHPNT